MARKLSSSTPKPPTNQKVARQLARLKVDVIEAGFPAASPGDFEAVRRIAQETKGGIAIAALARCRDGDPQRAIEAIRIAERPHLHVFIATSDIHLKHKLRISREEALAEAVRWVRHGREQLGSDAETAQVRLFQSAAAFALEREVHTEDRLTFCYGLRPEKAKAGVHAAAISRP